MPSKAAATAPGALLAPIAARTMLGWAWLVCICAETMAPVVGGPSTAVALVGCGAARVLAAAARASASELPDVRPPGAGALGSECALRVTAAAAAAPALGRVLCVSDCVRLSAAPLAFLLACVFPDAFPPDLSGSAA